MADKLPFGAVAVDLGASSGRFAAATVENGRIAFKVVHQAQHAPVDRDGHAFWNTEFLIGLCRQAVDYASSHFERATIGIDTWGCDHGFLDEDGKLVQDPIAYRDISHTAAFEELAPRRPELYAATGIQHQPFNSVIQLYARQKEHPDWPSKLRWLLLPDLLGYLLTGEANFELTEASTTQFLGLDCKWSPEAFTICGWPVPEQQPKKPGLLVGRAASNVELAKVASHDTASAVFGLNAKSDDIFLNVGTWSLLGVLLDEPVVTAEGQKEQWTNERAHDGRVRYLKNIPGFYIINRLHQELGIKESVPEWLSHADATFEGRFDYFDLSLYSPDSMLGACSALLDIQPSTPAEWATAALGSQVDAIVAQPKMLQKLTGQTYRRIRVAGGGSQSSAFCQALADGTGLPVVAGPSEATVLGNLALQFSAAGVCSIDEVAGLLDRSTAMKQYDPLG